jgi:hypothetical protein
MTRTDSKDSGDVFRKTCDSKVFINLDAAVLLERNAASL